MKAVSLFSPLHFPPLSKQPSLTHNTTHPTTLVIDPTSSSSSNKHDYSINNINLGITSLATNIPTKHSLLTLLFKSLDDLVSNVMDDSPLRPSIDPKHVLSGNFFPVDELPPTPCHVMEGVLPTALDGAYIRNGPNPHFVPTDSPYHLFDGDGMLHCIRIFHGNATFCSRYVRTHKFLVENELGHSFLPSPFSSFNGLWASVARSLLVVARALAGYFNPRLTGFGMANTSLALIGGALVALCETDLPYVVKVTPKGEIVTVARHDLRADNPPLRMTAHPKIDRMTGEGFAFSCDIFAPFLTFFRIDSRGRKRPHDVPIFSMTKPSLIHDFSVTERYIIFQDIQVGVSPVEIVRGRSPVVYDEAKVPRVGILPRRAEDESELTWVDTPGFNMMHVINAWEENSGRRIVILAPNVLSIEDGMETIDLFDSVIEKLTIDVSTKEVVKRETLSEKNLEFGVINPAYAGKTNRYAYAAIIKEMPKASGVVKLDLQQASRLREDDTRDCTVASRLYGSRCYGGEPQFVPREPDNPKADEDDGYLITYVHDENTEQSWFLVMDAKSDNLDIVAKVKLPGRVPYGFHGLFVSESDLKNNNDRYTT